jgi:signal transduction histidine kinase
MTIKKDPICGMELNEGEERSKLDFKSKEYSFCSESCEGLFKKLNGLEARPGEALAENERKMVAYNTLKQLAATIAHYIRNANAAVSAQAQLAETFSKDEAVRKYTSLIKKESARIESVVDALLSVSDIKLEKYVGSGEEAIFDLRNNLEGKLADLD